MVGPKLRERPEAWPRVRLPAPTEAGAETPPLAGLGGPQPQAPHVEGPHKRVVTYTNFDRGDAWTVTGKRERQECRPLKKHFAQRNEPPAVEMHPEAEPQGIG
eukprot:6470212-Amphidinium_carterae.1